MDSSIIWIIVVAIVVWFIFSRDREEPEKSQKIKSNSPSSKIPSQSNSSYNHKPSSPTSNTVHNNIQPRQHSSYNISEFSSSGDTIWEGSCHTIEIDYIDNKGVMTSRKVTPKRYFKRSSGNYLLCQCHLRNEERSFKTSRIGDSVKINEAHFSKNKFFTCLRNNNVSSLLERKIPADNIERNVAASNSIKGYLPSRVNDYDILNSVFNFDYSSGHGTTRPMSAKLKFKQKVNGKLHLSGNLNLTNEDKKFRVDRISPLLKVGSKTIRRSDLVAMLPEKDGSSLNTITARNTKPTSKGSKPRKTSNKAKNDSLTKWREKGLLSLRGYRVGKTKGIPEHNRRTILTELLNTDTLLDVSDREYAAEWGRPGTKQRYEKLFSTIKSFSDIASKRRGKGKGDLSQALKEWNDDLKFLKNMKP